MAPKATSGGASQQTFIYGHGNEAVTLTATRYQSSDFRKPEHSMRRITVQQVEKIRGGQIGTTFSGGQVWTAEYLAAPEQIFFQNDPLSLIYVVLKPFKDNAQGNTEFLTLNLDQLANKYSQVQPADVRKPEQSNEKTLANLRFVSRSAYEVPIYHYWVVPERGDQETPSLNDTSIPVAPDFPATQLTQQQLDSLAIDEHSANRQHANLKKQFEEALQSTDRKIHPPRFFDGQGIRNMENQIHPESLEFETELEYYSTSLKNIPDDQSLYDWMNREFSKERMLLLDPSIHENLQEIQNSQKELYRELLRSESFRKLKSNAVLKFTMAYFGLPVQPLTNKDLIEARKGESPKTGVRDANAFDKDGDDDEENGMYGSKVIWYSEKPLEFLDTYHERNLGYPMLRRKLNPHYKAAPPTISQRGGGPVLRLRGGAGAPPSTKPASTVDIFSKSVARHGIKNEHGTVKEIIRGLLGLEHDEYTHFKIDTIPRTAYDKDNPLAPLNTNVLFRTMDITMSEFTEEKFKQDVQRSSSPQHVYRVYRSDTAPYPALMETLILPAAQSLQLNNPVNNDFSLFTFSDLSEAGNAVNDDTQVAFKEALVKLYYPLPIIGMDFQWEIMHVNHTATGIFRPDQGVCLTPELRKILKAQNGNSAEKLAFQLNVTLKAPKGNQNLMRILIPGSAGIHAYPRQNNRKYTEVPEEVFVALEDKVKEGDIQYFMVWDGYESWKSQSPADVMPFRRVPDKNQDPNGFTAYNSFLETFNSDSFSSIVVKPFFQSFTLEDATNPISATAADKPGNEKNWTPKPLISLLNDFWDRVDQLFANKPSAVKIKRIFDEAISSYITRDYDETKFKLEVFDALDSDTIYIEAHYGHLPPKTPQPSQSNADILRDQALKKQKELEEQTRQLELKQEQDRILLQQKQEREKLLLKQKQQLEQHVIPQPPYPPSPQFPPVHQPVIPPPSNQPGPQFPPDEQDQIEERERLRKLLEQQTQFPPPVSSSTLPTPPPGPIPPFTLPAPPPPPIPPFVPPALPQGPAPATPLAPPLSPPPLQHPPVPSQFPLAPPLGPPLPQQPPVPSQFPSSNGPRNTVHDPIPNDYNYVDPRYRAWNKYMAREQANAVLKHKSWTEPLSVCQPGAAPQPQIFGPAKEAMIYGGRGVPILYHHDFYKTPTQINDLEQELYRSRNDILQRKEMCVICNHIFAPGALHEQEKTDHIKQHQDAIESAGECPICDLPSYKFMTKEEKLQHILGYHMSNVLPNIHNSSNPSFLVNRPPFDPKEVYYCSKCGSDISKLSDNEKADHVENCKLPRSSTTERNASGQVTEAEREKVKLDAKIESQKRSLAELEAQILKQRNSLNELDTQIETREKEMEAQNETSQHSLATSGTQNQNQKSLILRMEKEIQTHKNELEIHKQSLINSEAKSKKQEEARLQALRTRLQRKIDIANEENFRLKEEVEAALKSSVIVDENQDSEKCAELQKQLFELEASHRAISSRLDLEKAKLQKDLDKTAKAYNNDTEKLRNQLTTLENNLQNAVKDNSLLKEKLSQTEKSILDNQQNNNTLSDLTNTAINYYSQREQHSQTEKNLKAAHDSISSIQQKLAQAEKDLKVLNDGISSKQQELDRAKKELSENKKLEKERQLDATKDLEAQRSQNKGLQESVSTLEKEIQRLQDEISTAGNNYDLLKQNFDTAEIALVEYQTSGTMDLETSRIITGLDKPSSGAEGSDALNCPLCDHVYENMFDNKARYEHFYDHHILDLAFPDNIETPIETSNTTTGNTEVERSAYHDVDHATLNYINKTLTYYKKPKAPDSRPPYFIKCQYPSVEACDKKWNSNDYWSVDEMRAEMDAHQQEHISREKSVEELEKLEPDYWTCKRCLFKRGVWIQNPEDTLDRTRYTNSAWAEETRDHIKKTHKDIKELILQPEDMFISKKTWEIKQAKGLAWDCGYFKPMYERYEMRRFKERGKTYFEILPDAKLKPVDPVEKWLKDTEAKKAEDERKRLAKEKEDKETHARKEARREQREILRRAEWNARQEKLRKIQEEQAKQDEEDEKGDEEGDEEDEQEEEQGGEDEDEEEDEDEGDEANEEENDEDEEGAEEEGQDEEEEEKEGVEEERQEDESNNNTDMPTETSATPLTTSRSASKSATPFPNPHPASWTCPICKLTISPLPSDNYVSNYIKKIITHHPSAHADQTPYIHKCHLCEQVFRKRRPVAPGAFDPALAEKHYADVHPETVHRELPSGLVWHCPICYTSLKDLPHFDRLDHLQNCNPSLTTELKMIAIHPRDAALHAQRYKAEYAKNVTNVLHPNPTTSSTTTRKKKNVTYSKSLVTSVDIPPTNEGKGRGNSRESSRLGGSRGRGTAERGREMPEGEREGAGRKRVLTPSSSSGGDNAERGVNKRRKTNRMGR